MYLVGPAPHVTWLEPRCERDISCQYIVQKGEGFQHTNSTTCKGGNIWRTEWNVWNLLIIFHLILIISQMFSDSELALYYMLHLWYQVSARKIQNFSPHLLHGCPWSLLAPDGVIRAPFLLHSFSCVLQQLHLLIFNSWINDKWTSRWQEDLYELVNFTLLLLYPWERASDTR